MTRHIKLRLMLIAAVVFTLSQLGWAQAANLRNVRTGKHEKFSRIVFEFQDNVLFESPEIKGKGKFSVVFLDSSTTLPRLTLFKTGPIQLVHSIEFVRQKSNLIANVRLSFPYFILKSFPLSGPNRIVVDAYQVPSLHENSEQEESLHEKPLTETSTSPEEEELKKDFGKAADSQSLTLSDVEKSGSKETQPPEKVISNNVSNQIPEQDVGSSSSSNGNAMTQIYLLVVLNVLTSVIVVLLIFTLLKKRHTIDFGDLYEIMEFTKTSDKSIETIDAQLKNAFKEYDEI